MKVVERSLTPQSINPNFLNIQYAVRGPIVDRASQIERELEMGVPKSFDRVVRANIGDCHRIGQKPITFLRQVAALAACPQLASSPDIPDDVKERVRELLKECKNGSVGSYTLSSGLKIVRTHVAEFLERRDGVPASPDDIYLGSGASDVIKAVMTMLVKDVDGKPPAVMIPIPQYPLFSGTMLELGLRQACYYLDEEASWALRLDELERCWREASKEVHVTAIVVINPGNPTGQVLSHDNIEIVIKFAYEHNLLLLIDEVYQEALVGKPFHSFKKVMHSMEPPYNNMELASFHACTKGWAAECGLRAGFVELLRIDPVVKKAFSTARSVQQCPSVLGQCVLDCVMKPPSPGSASHEQFLLERAEIQRMLTARTVAACEIFNSIPGYSCSTINGATYAFPKIEIPERAQVAAREQNLSPDEFYCLRLLEETGVCVVPGTGFGQAAGTFHFRTTILHPDHEFRYMMESIASFHSNFIQLYS